jgi:hypothetical protein
MDAALSAVRHRTRRHGVRAVAFTIAATAAVGLSFGCATGGHHADDDAMHPVNVEINNNLTIPTVITVYVDQGGNSRRMLGTVPGAQTRTFQFTPVSFSQPYRLIAQRQLARDVRSQPFTIGSDMTGTVEWSLVPNIVGFYDVADTVSTPAPAPAPTPPAKN